MLWRALPPTLWLPIFAETKAGNTLDFLVKVYGVIYDRAMKLGTLKSCVSMGSMHR